MKTQEILGGVTTIEITSWIDGGILNPREMIRKIMDVILIEL